MLVTLADLRGRDHRAAAVGLCQIHACETGENVLQPRAQMISATARTSVNSWDTKLHSLVRSYSTVDYARRQMAERACISARPAPRLHPRPDRGPRRRDRRGGHRGRRGDHRRLRIPRHRRHGPHSDQAPQGQGTQRLGEDGQLRVGQAPRPGRAALRRTQALAHTQPTADRLRISPNRITKVVHAIFSVTRQRSSLARG
jgi:hypothetical protein